MRAGVCFYCSNPINGETQPYVTANTVAHYKHGGQRMAQRNFHESCFDKFVKVGGRPYNPDTDYEVTQWWLARGDWKGDVVDPAKEFAAATT